MTDKNSWSKTTIANLSWDVHAKLRTFTESVGELDADFEVESEHPVHDEYRDYVKATHELHHYLYPEEH